MCGLLGPILKTPILISLLRLVRGFKLPALRKAASAQPDEHSVGPDLETFNCRVQLARQRKDGCVFDVFTVEVCGSIHAPSDVYDVIVQILVADVTDGIPKAKPVHSCVNQWQKQDSPAFCYQADLGKIPDADTIISDWMTVARLRLDWLMFPLKGKRNLRFSTSIISRHNGQELACAVCSIDYENSKCGYMDLQENIQQARTLAVALAFAVSAADGRLYDCEIELIKGWTKASMDFSNAPSKARRTLERALNEAIDFFRNGNQIDVCKICKEIVEIVPVAVRYDILEFCLHVARANGVATAKEMGLLRNLAIWLEVDVDRFREMMVKILPVSMHEVKDLEFTLGVNPDMNKNETLRRLNREYRKWNARVTNSDPEIRKQADNMLNVIADARSECTG
ncbi:MAG: tellurite resistance TerB family protein [Planctomycetota bacterium]|jgi:tellurite resistance protein